MEASMRNSLIVATLFSLLLPAAALANADSPADSLKKAANLPASELTAKTALETTPRHGELVDVPLSGGTPIRTWISYPEKSQKAGVVIVIHEIYGLTDWIRGVADQLAAEGFI